MRKWLKGAHVSGVRGGSPAVVRRREWVEMGVRDENSTAGRP